MKKSTKKAAKRPAKKLARKAAKKAPPKAARKVARKATTNPATKPAKAAARRPAPRMKAQPNAKPKVKAAPKPKAKVVTLHPQGPKPIPDGYHSVTAYLCCDGAARAIDFYKRAFGAIETVRMPGPGGVVMHAEIRIGDSVVMLSDEFPGQYVKAPTTLGGSSAQGFLYVKDVDAFVVQAVKHGATVTMPIADMFWGDRFGKVRDPFGHEWGIATHKEDVTPAQMAERMAAMGPPPAPGSDSGEPPSEPPPEAA